MYVCVCVYYLFYFNFVIVITLNKFKNERVKNLFYLSSHIYI